MTQRHIPGVLGIDGEPGGDTVVADEPQADGNQQEGQAPADIGWQLLPGFRDGIFLGVGILIAFLLGCQLGLVDKQHENHHGSGHNAPYNEEQGEIGDVVVALGGIQEPGDQQVQNAAHSAHEIDDGVGLGAQGLGGDVRHQCHRRAAVGAHGHQQHSQHHHEQHELTSGGGGVVAVRQQGQTHHQNDGSEGAEEDIGTAAAQRAFAFIRKSAEQRQQEQSQHIVRGHDGAGEGFVHVEGVGEDQGHQIVIHLPEGADGQKGKAHQHGVFGVQLHGTASACKNN